MNGNEILKAALLGTDKFTPQASASLHETGARIMAQPTDKEDRFIKIAITTLLYEEAGRKPALIEGSVTECPAENHPYINDKLSGKIKTCLSTKDDVFFHYCIYLVHVRNQLLTPDLVPMVLNKALDNKKIAQSLVNVCGEKGKWLCKLNLNWRSLLDEGEDDNVWETGSFESRRIFLADIRKADPARAIELLKGTFDKESAANRASFSEVLHHNLSLSDEPFLQKLLQDKSQKVKETATSLLQKLQGSAINTRYLNYLLNVMLVKEERYLLVTKRKVITIREDLLPGDDIFSTGIDKVSSNKDVPDHVYVIGQILRFIDPAILAAQLNTTEEELITLLLQQKDAEQLLPYLADAAGKFRNRVWAMHLLNKKETSYIILLDALPNNERMNFYQLFVDDNVAAVLHYLFDESYTIMPMRLGIKLIEHFSKQPYSIPQAGYQRLALHLPYDMVSHLKRYAESASADYQDKYFKTQATEMMRVIEIRNNTN